MTALLWLPLAVLVLSCLVMNLAALRRRSRKRRGIKRAARYVTDLCAVLPLTPLPPQARVYRRPAQIPRIVPDVPEQCWCGRGARWHLPQYVTDALHHPTVAETVDADSMTFPAVTP